MPVNGRKNSSIGNKLLELEIDNKLYPKEPTSNLDPKVVSIRDKMTDFMNEVSDKLTLKSYTTQLAIVYLDRLIHKFEIHKIHAQAELWALALLLIASKFNENDVNIPYIDDFKKASQVKYSYNSIVRCEKEICKKLQWNFLQLCPLTFTYGHQHFGMLFSDDKLLVGKFKPIFMEISKMLGMSKEVKSQLKAKLKNIYKYSEFFTNVTLQMPDLQKYPYSLQSL